jgi:hypothetical protein
MGPSWSVFVDERRRTRRTYPRNSSVDRTTGLAQ